MHVFACAVGCSIEQMRCFLTLAMSSSCDIILFQCRLGELAHVDQRKKGSAQN